MNDHSLVEGREEELLILLNEQVLKERLAKALDRPGKHGGSIAKEEHDEM